MNRFMIIVSTTLVATAAFGGASFAAMSPVDQALAADRNPRFIVTTIDSMEKHDLREDIYGSRTPASPEARELYTAINENPVLRKELLKEDIQLQNLVAVEEAADGSFILYLR